MKPCNSVPMAKLGNWVVDFTYEIKHMVRRLQDIGRGLSEDQLDVHGAIHECQDGIQNLSKKLAELSSAMKEVTKENRYSRFTELSSEDIDRLIAINRNLRKLPEYLHTIARDVTPRLERKLADPADPMYDYELELRMDFTLQENDPLFDDNDDNILTTRRHHSNLLGRLRKDEENVIFSEIHTPEKLAAEPHCWLFHDLYDHSYGANSPSLSLKDCLRVGKIWIDVEISQQYEFDITTGEMVARESADHTRTGATTDSPTVD